MKNTIRNVRGGFTLRELIFVMFVFLVVIPAIGGIGYVIFHFIAKAW